MWSALSQHELLLRTLTEMTYLAPGSVSLPKLEQNCLFDAPLPRQKLFTRAIQVLIAFELDFLESLVKLDHFLKGAYCQKGCLTLTITG